MLLCSCYMVQVIRCVDCILALTCYHVACNKLGFITEFFQTHTTIQQLEAILLTFGILVGSSRFLSPIPRGISTLGVQFRKLTHLCLSQIHSISNSWQNPGSDRLYSKSH